MSGSFGSMRTWLKYIGRGLALLTLRQVPPASSDRYRPVGSFGFSRPAAAAESARAPAARLRPRRRGPRSFVAGGTAASTAAAAWTGPSIDA